MTTTDSLDLHTLRRIFLRNYTRVIPIGVHAHEKQAPQRVIFNVDVYTVRHTPNNDDITEVLDYDFIHRAIQKLTNGRHIELQETICDNLAADLLAHPLVQAVRVSTLKPDIYADCDGIGLEVFLLKHRSQ